MESIGFKEWAVVCEALGSGRQSIILRKGGIAEGREGFSFKHREFFLFRPGSTNSRRRCAKANLAMPEQRPGENRDQGLGLTLELVAQHQIMGSRRSTPTFAYPAARSCPRTFR